MPLKGGKSKKIIQQNIEELIKSGKRPDVAVAIAHDVANKGKDKKKRKGK